MTHRNGIGKQGVRLAIFRAHADPLEGIAAAEYVGPTNYFSLVWTSSTEACLYVHDEYTPGGHLIACTNLASPEEIVGLRYEDCTIYVDLSDAQGENPPVTRTVSLDVPELCLHAADLELNEDTEEVCLIMTDGTRHCVDLSPVLHTYEVRENSQQAGQYCFFRDGVSQICWWEGGFSVLNPDGSVTITNPDGTTVDIPAPLEPSDITIVHSGNGQTVCLQVDGAQVGCWRQGDIVSEDDETAGTYYALKPDGTRVAWIGTDHVTTASMNAVERSVTVTNPDGQSITFPYGESEQTRVTRGTGTREQIQTLTADHNGTWPNTSWRETWMQRNGDIVTIHSWNPIENEWDAVAVEAPENVVILNNPTIYIRKATGSANPPINTQADLTPANAFNSFTAMLAFIKRSYVVGSITVDVEGTFGSREVPTFSASAYKNASAVYLRGNPANVSAFTVQIGDELDTNSTAIIARFGIDLFISNMAWQWLDVTSGNFNPNIACSADQNGTITIRDTVRVYGTYNTERVGAPNAICFFANGGRITMESGTTVIFDMTAGSALGSYFSTSRGGQLSYGAIECRLLRNHKATMSVFSATVSGTLRFSGGNPPAFDQPPTFTGAGSFDAPNIARMQVLSTTDLVNSQGFGGFGNLADWLQANMNLTGGAVTNPVFYVDAYSFFGNKYGSEWTADPRFSGA